eukprot:g1252.t1
MNDVWTDIEKSTLNELEDEVQKYAVSQIYSFFQCQHFGQYCQPYPIHKLAIRDSKVGPKAGKGVFLDTFLDENGNQHTSSTPISGQANKQEQEQSPLMPSYDYDSVILPGRVVALVPGLVFERTDIERAYINGMPVKDYLFNPYSQNGAHNFVVTRHDGIVIDGLPLPGKKSTDADGPLHCELNFAVGQYVNHPGRRSDDPNFCENPNTMLCPITFDMQNNNHVNEGGMDGGSENSMDNRNGEVTFSSESCSLDFQTFADLVPNRNFTGGITLQTPLKSSHEMGGIGSAIMGVLESSMSDLMDRGLKGIRREERGEADLKGGGARGGRIKGLALIATQPIQVGDEITMDYRYSSELNPDLLPDWYRPVEND